MTGFEILDFEPVNPVFDEEKVDMLFNSISKDGWKGCPILTYGNCLLTGSHRQAALQKMAEEDMDLSFECAEDVTDIIEDKFTEGMTEQEIFENLDCLREIFTGTWVEEYKSELTEW